MKIIDHEFPPNYEAIIAVFPYAATQKHVLFSYGDKIYNPSGKEIPPYTIAHEEVHSREQLHGTAECWWNTYFHDPKFRLQEELAAYRVEYRVFCKLHKDRNERAGFLNFIAVNLSGPGYGNLCSKDEAMKQIRT